MTLAMNVYNMMRMEIFFLPSFSDTWAYILDILSIARVGHWYKVEKPIFVIYLLPNIISNPVIKQFYSPSPFHEF